MKFLTKYLLISVLPVILICTSAKCQIAISNVSEIPKIKKGTTYIVMKDPNSEKSKEFREIYEKYWTYSKAEFIKFSDINKYLSAENSFLDICGYETIVKGAEKLDIHGEISYDQSRRREWSIIRFYLELWTCDEKWLKKNKQKRGFIDEGKKIITKIELGTDQYALLHPEALYQSDYDGKEHLQNWGTGFLKNYIQLIERSLKNGIEQKYNANIDNYPALKSLKTDTLFIPAYVLIKYAPFKPEGSVKHDENELFGKYKYKYKIITREELNEKILKDENPFFYILYTLASGFKNIVIVNSHTGELVYSSCVTGFYNFKSGDMKDIQKSIE